MPPLSRYIFLLPALLFTLPALGQFSLPSTRDTPLSTLPMADTMSRREVDNPYFSRARWLAERKALRKERNTIEFNASLTATQTQFIDWQAGGDNTFTGISQIFYHHLYKRETFSLDYRIDARYGANYIDKVLFKNVDEWKFNLQTAWKLRGNWSYAATTSARSQFSEGVKSRTDDTKVSNFMAPGFFDLSVGFNWKSKPWDITLSPIAGSVTVVLDEQLQQRGINGVPKGDKTKGQLGPSARIFFDKEFGRKMFRYRSDLYAFTNIRTAPKVRWENTFEIKATKLLSTKIYCLMYYEKPSIDKLQYQYSLSLGISYWLKNK